MGHLKIAICHRSVAINCSVHLELVIGHLRLVMQNYRVWSAERSNRLPETGNEIHSKSPERGNETLEAGSRTEYTYNRLPLSRNMLPGLGLAIDNTSN